MIGKSKWFLVLTVLFWNCVNAGDYQLILSDNSPVTTGSNVTLNAKVVNSRGACVVGKLIFHYEDDAFQRRHYEIKTSNCEVVFHILTEPKLGATTFRYQVDVKEELMPFINRPIASNRGFLNVTEELNGQLLLFQNNTNVSKSSPITYVSTGSELVQTVEINAADYEYLNQSASSIIVHWFVDCIYQGNTTSYSFSSNYTQPETQHEVLGIVVANIGPPPQPTPTPVPTTTASPNTTTTTAATTTTTAAAATTTTTAAPAAVNTTAAANSTTANLITSSTPKTLKLDSPHNIINSNFTSECQNKKNLDLLLSAVQLKNKQKYGYFSRSILVKDPVANVKTQGKVWIQEGEMLDLQVSCNGSGPFRYCAHYVQGPYNVTGNETCLWDRNLVSCQMQFFHYFREPTNYTLVVIMVNDVSKVVTPIGINIYKVQKQPQISVIVVPVTFSSIAIIIVVFGIAYYFQNRSRFMVEVADFDFANNSDMEYKTFRERLRDAISQAINRTQDYSEYDGSEEQIGGLATPQNQKYGSMQ